MFDYMNGEPSPIMLSGEETGYRSEPNRPVFNPYAAQNFTGTIDFINPETHFTAVTATSSHHPFYHPQSQNPNNHFHNFSDSRAYTAPSSSYPNSHAPSSLTLVVDPTEFTFVPKSEFGTGFSNRIGLNLGGRTYFANSEDDFVNRLYGRSRIVEPGSVNSPRCQAEGCNADLTHVKHYHRRHKVCEFHSKAATVVTAGLTQRFCQQCSRFHVLSEFDNVKRSCRRRLADHNRRRRKSQQTHQVENNNKSQLDDNAPIISSPQNLDGSPFGDSHSSSVTAAISPPRISLDSFGHRSSILREQLSSGHYNSHN